jgi:hypothetical protein
MIDLEQRVIQLEKEIADLKVQHEDRLGFEKRIRNIEFAYIAMRGDMQYSLELFQNSITKVVADIIKKQ